MSSFYVSTQKVIESADPKDVSRERLYYNLRNLTKPWLTWHTIEEAFSSTRISLQVLAIFRPVQMSYKTRASFTFAHLLVLLSYSIDVYEIIIRSNCQVLTIRGVLHLMDDFSTISDMSDLGKISVNISVKKKMVTKQ